jgi:excisionase family DNA binding protein
METQKSKSKLITRTAGYRSVDFAADYTGMSEKTILRRIRDGSLPAFHVGDTRTIRLRIEDLDALMVPIEV